jgi:hypothetical protein
MVETNNTSSSTTPTISDDQPEPEPETDDGSNGCIICKVYGFGTPCESEFKDFKQAALNAKESEEITEQQQTAFINFTKCINDNKDYYIQRMADLGIPTDELNED